MQMYTRILIGMVIGTLLGLFLGPSSPWLSADTYRARDAASFEFRLDLEEAHSALSLPKGTLDFQRIEPVGAPVGERFDAHSAQLWMRVRLKIDERLLLRAGDRLKALGQSPRVGDPLEGWIALPTLPDAAGEPQPQLRALSGFGLGMTDILRPIGQAFMRGIQMVIVPLVFASLLVGIAGLGDLRKLGRMGGRTLLLYLSTTAVAVVIGLVVTHLLARGRFIDATERTRLMGQFAESLDQKSEAAAQAPTVIESLLQVIPTNPMASLVQGDMLQIIFFAVLLGVALTRLGESVSASVVHFFDVIQKAMVVLINLVMQLAPFGVAALVADVVGQSGLGVLKALLVYSFTVLFGLALHLMLTYGTLVRFVARLPLRRFSQAVRPAQLMGFSTSSSSATLPITIECAEKNIGISNSTASFILPLGSTVNMDGTALYQGVAALFIAQVFGLDLTIGDQVAIVTTATLASVGAAGVPGAGMVTLMMVLTTVGIPPEGLALILGMDRLLDMFRTTINISGDLAVAACIARMEGEPLDLLEAPAAPSEVPPQTLEEPARADRKPD